MSDAIDDAIQGGDAFEGDSAQATDSYTASGYFDSPDSLPGFGVNTGVSGATVGPEQPVAGAQLNAEIGSVTTEFDPTSLAGLNNANAALPSNLMNNLGATPTAGAAPPPTSAAGQVPPPPQIPPIDWVSGGGYLAAVVPYADASLQAAVASAASGAGGQAALMAGTVSLSGQQISAGGGTSVGSRNVPASVLVFGSESGTAPQFHGGAHWFGPTVQSWYDQMVQQIMAEQQQAAGGAPATSEGGPSGGIPASAVPGLETSAFGESGMTFAPGTTADAMGNPVGQAVSQSAWSQAWVGDMTSPVFGDAPTDSKIDAALNASMDQWGAGGTLPGIMSSEQNTAAGLDSPDAGFEGLGHDPLSDTGAGASDPVWDESQ